MKNIVELKERVIHNKNSFTQYYLLLDTAQNHLYIREWLKTLPNERLKSIANLFEGTIDESAPLEVSPLLIELQPKHVDFYLNALANEDNFEMSSIIETELTKQQLIQHLQPFLEAELPDGGFALFRFFDPYIIKSLDKILDKETYHFLIEPMDSWWYQVSEYHFKNKVSR